MKNIEPKFLNESYNIIDIRDNNRYMKEHILNAKNIEYKELINNYMYYLNKNETYFIYCEFGKTSKIVCDLLKKLGYDVINVYGGFDYYKKNKNF